MIHIYHILCFCEYIIVIVHFWYAAVLSFLREGRYCSGAISHTEAAKSYIISNIRL